MPGGEMDWRRYGKLLQIVLYYMEYRVGKYEHKKNILEAISM